MLALTQKKISRRDAFELASASGFAAAGLTLAIGIGLQNLPEGLAVALALITENYLIGRA